MGTLETIWSGRCSNKATPCAPACATQTIAHRSPVAVAWFQERWAQWTGRPAQLLLSQVRKFWGIRQEYSILKAKAELGFNPRPAEAALRSAFAYLQRRADQTRGAR
jgi:hypothetical protein